MGLGDREDVHQVTERPTNESVSAVTLIIEYSSQLTLNSCFTKADSFFK